MLVGFVVAENQPKDCSKNLSFYVTKIATRSGELGHNFVKWISGHSFSKGFDHGNYRLVFSLHTRLATGHACGLCCFLLQLEQAEEIGCEYKNSFFNFTY
jgi:hypothetical protein